MDTDYFLDKKKPSFIGGILEMMNNRLYGFWGNPEEGLHTGFQQNKFENGQNLSAAFCKDDKGLKEFINAMSSNQMGNILHDWDEENKILLMKKAYDAIQAGGSFVAIEGIIDDERRKNVFGLMMSLNMLIETG
jgi:hypothetical protein